MKSGLMEIRPNGMRVGSCLWRVVVYSVFERSSSRKYARVSAIKSRDIFHLIPIWRPAPVPVRRDFHLENCRGFAMPLACIIHEGTF
jgi:hypothetical protein